MTHAIHDRFLDIAPGLSPELAGALAALGSVELPVRDDTPFPEYLARAVAGQQLSVKAARSIWGRVETACADGPLVEAFCDGRADELRACGLSGAKVKTLLAIGAAARAGRLDGEGLRALDPQQRAAELTSLWGVGQWTADMANMFWFGEEDIWPDGDVAARKTLERLTSPRRKTVRTAARFAPHRSHLALYMWRWVDARPD
jgi:DNA-3-methyladenine glycosylase II